MQPIETQIRRYTIIADNNRSFLAAIPDEGTCRTVTLHYLENQKEKSTTLVVTGDEKAITHSAILTLETVYLEVAFIRKDNSKPDVMECNLSVFVDCVCQEKIQKLEKCVICKKESEHSVYRDDCPVHIEKVVLICGQCEYVCSQCTEEGWYSTAGRGGGAYHMNIKTGETKK